MQDAELEKLPHIKPKIPDALTDARIRQLLRKGGCLAESRGCYNLIREMIKKYIESLLRNTFTHAQHLCCQTGTADVILRSEPFGVTMLGFGGHLGIRYVWNDVISAVSS